MPLTPPANHLEPLADTLRPKRARMWARIEAAAQVAGVAAAAVRLGLRPTSGREHHELGALVVLALVLLTVGLYRRYRWSRVRSTFVSERRIPIAVSASWLVGVIAILIFDPLLPQIDGRPISRSTAIVFWSELVIIVRGAYGVVAATRRAAAGGMDPGLLLVLSFLALVTVGTLLLMLPRSRALTGEETGGAPFLTALFTSTSASCVTGLIVEPTGPYWSPFGQKVILCLFQIGGLGIMTWGAFFAAASGGMHIRESETLRDLLESEHLGNVRQLLLAILGTTVVVELAGAVLLFSLWPDMPLGRRTFFALFHSISAFCNAGFALTEDSFVGMGGRWQVGGVLAAQIIAGGLGFAALYNVGIVVKTRFSRSPRTPLFGLPRFRTRLTLATKLVLVTTLVLLLVGGVGFFMLESTGDVHPDPMSTRAADAWFQSVTFRTAGFNTVDHGEMRTATKLFAVPLMFIGASPGSTGGGVKTICFALVVLALLSILKGRRRVEVMGRTISDDLVKRALTIIMLGMAAVMSATMLLVVFEPKSREFIDLLYEAASAFGTVGVSTGVTGELSTPSRLVIIVTMFAGRVGPLTLLIGLAGRADEARYEYPLERVTLG